MHVDVLLSDFTIHDYLSRMVEPNYERLIRMAFDEVIAEYKRVECEVVIIPCD